MYHEMVINLCKEQFHNPENRIQTEKKPSRTYLLAVTGGIDHNMRVIWKFSTSDNGLPEHYMQTDLDNAHY